MVFKIDFNDRKTVLWSKENGETTKEVDDNYRPRFYIDGNKSELHKSRPWISRQENVKATKFERWKPTLCKPETDVLRIDVAHEDDLKPLVYNLKKNFGRTRFRFYNVDLSPQFRYCIQENLEPKPDSIGQLSRVDLNLDRKSLANKDLSELEIDYHGEGSIDESLSIEEKLREVFQSLDPDIILVSRGQLLELIDQEFSFPLGRINGFEQLAGENTVSCYGKTVHSNARYNIPGRVIIDRSNSFLLDEAKFHGLWDLVERSYRPIQELAWGSIGRLLTSIEIKEAYINRNILTPWKNWEGEKPKKASTMHKADRGGFIFNPKPGIKEDVYEADFASLFPNIMVEKRISPETVCCSCCDNEAVPELDYSICENKKDDAFISDVIQPLVDYRQKMKEDVRGMEECTEKRRKKASIDAIKWLLVSCFGYMGHSHASYGAIRCHQAIQAFDREIMVEAKEMLEQNGYNIVHGIIDSIWVQENDNPQKFEEVCQEVTDEIGIELEPEYKFEWCAFIPRSSSEADIGTLNRYFGKKEDGDFKTAGIEVEQDSTCEFVKEAQMEMIKALDNNMNPSDVMQVLRERIEQLEEGLKPEKFVITKKVGKKVENYSSKNKNYCASKRASEKGMEIRPGQEISYIVRDDSAEPLDRVRLDFEELNRIDEEFYTKQLVRACESVLSPLGIKRETIWKRLDPIRQKQLSGTKN
ncbi:hypothetical protein GLU60_00920 [Nanohaloarchaea archaeon H01]|nr:hypothetical protein [Nanohaloarchaea archaeon H01]